MTIGSRVMHHGNPKYKGEVIAVRGETNKDEGKFMEYLVQWDTVVSPNWYLAEELICSPT
jgi:hypothetical protein